MSITPCKDPTSNDENFKSNTYYPPGIISKHKELEYYRDFLFEFHLKFLNTASIGIPVRSLL